MVIPSVRGLGNLHTARSTRELELEREKKKRSSKERERRKDLKEKLLECFLFPLLVSYSFLYCQAHA